MDAYTKTAILSAIRIERESHDFYRIAADQTIDPDTKNLFQKLAREELEHMLGFIKIYPGDEDDVATAAYDKPDEYFPGTSNLRAYDGTLLSREAALSVAMKEENSCIELYSGFLDAIRIPEICRVFERALTDTRNHLETIEAEYAHCMGMVDDVEMDTYVRE